MTRDGVRVFLEVEWSGVERREDEKVYGKMELALHVSATLTGAANLHRHPSQRLTTKYAFPLSTKTPSPFRESLNQDLLVSSDTHLSDRREDSIIDLASSEDSSSFLSLSDKPGRSMGVLDDYQMEDHDFSAPPNHQSGLLCAFFIHLLSFEIYDSLANNSRDLCRLRGCAWEAERWKEYAL